MSDRPTLEDLSSAAKGNGLACPQCGCSDLRASYRRPFKGGFRRVRVCRNCGHRVMTFESITGNANRRDDGDIEGPTNLIPFPSQDCSNNRTTFGESDALAAYG